MAIDAVIDGKRFDWRGVDKFTIRDGKIWEEIVYFDTAPLHTRRSGQVLDALVRLPQCSVQAISAAKSDRP